MRLKHLDILRGVAAVMVALFHLEKSTLIPQTTNYFEYGYTGVQIFFVISGFILPYSLYKSHYQIKHFGTFLIKRIVRIHPAYIAAILCGVILTIITGRELSSVGGLFSQVLFVNSLFDQPFSSAVFWTLAIEFQFYILISLLYPLLLSNSRSFLIVVLLSAVSVSVQSGAHIFKWMPFFGAGILIFNFRCTKMPGTAFCAATIALITFICLNSEVAQCTAATFAILFILFAQFEKATILHQLFLFLGSVSYSLYLTHWDLGRMALRLTRHIPVIAKIPEIRLLLGLMFSVFFAWLFYIIIEKPSAAFSAKLRYKKQA